MHLNCLFWLLNIDNTFKLGIKMSLKYEYFINFPVAFSLPSYCFYDLQIQGFCMVNIFHSYWSICFLSWFSQIWEGCCLLYPVSTLKNFPPILVITIILKLLISFSVFSERLLFFEGQGRKHFQVYQITFGA